VAAGGDQVVRVRCVTPQGPTHADQSSKSRALSRSASICALCASCCDWRARGGAAVRVCCPWFTPQGGPAVHNSAKTRTLGWHPSPPVSARQRVRATEQRAPARIPRTCPGREGILYDPGHRDEMSRIRFASRATRTPRRPPTLLRLPRATLFLAIGHGSTG